MAGLSVTAIVLLSSPPEIYHTINTVDSEPHRSTRAPPIVITITYDPDGLPDGVDKANLVTAFLDKLHISNKTMPLKRSMTL